jgi:hypothetical protein
MARQDPPSQSTDYLRQGRFQNSTFEESLPRWSADANNAIGATGVAHATPIPLQAGEVISNITFVTATTAAGTPTAGFVALYSSAATPALLGQSADFATTARAANTAYTVPLATPVTIERAGLYWVSIAFAAATVPTLRGATLGNAALAAALRTGMPVAAQSHGSSLTGTAPATIASPTAVATPCYYILD